MTGIDSRYMPYPKYRPSGIGWIGNIPAHWEITSIKDFSYMNNRALSEKTPSDFVIQYIDISNVDSNGDIKDIIAYKFEDAPSRARRVVQNGDIIISTVRTYLQAIASIVHPPDNLVVSTGFAVISPIPVKCESRFCHYALREKSFLDKITAYSTGVSYPAINASELAKIQIPLPPPHEQHAIADFLDRETAKIDTLIEKKQRLLDLLAERRQALISHVVTKGLNPDVPVKPSGVEWIGDIPKHWHTNLLKFVCSINPRMRNRVKQDSDSMVTFLPMEKIGEKGELILEEERPLHEVIQGFTYFEENDVLIAKITPCFENGKGAIAKCLKNKLGFGTTELHVLRPSTAITSEYLYYLTQSDYFRLPGIAMMEGAAGQKRLKVDYLKKFIMVIPPKAEQYIIVGYLNEKTAKIDCLMQKVEQAIELLKERRTALISEAVTGKINVSDGVQSYDISNLTA